MDLLEDACKIDLLEDDVCKIGCNSSCSSTGNIGVIIGANSKKIKLIGF